MKRTVPQSIGDVLRLSLQQDCMQGRLDEVRAVEAWPRVLGEALASQTRRPTVRNGIMTVGIPNAALRHELSMTRSLLRRELNRTVGRDVIKEIRFVN